jgi:exosortase/archaeosortase family protein
MIPLGSTGLSRSGTVRVLARYSLVTVLLAVVAAIVTGHAFYRATEAALAAGVLRFVGVASFTSQDVFYVPVRHGVVGLEVTPECTAILLIAPLVMLAAVLVLVARAPVVRALLGVVGMVVIVTVINEIRLAVIGWSTQRWGIDPGYEISHTFVGSVIGIAGFAVGLAFLLVVALGHSKRRSRTPHHAA